MNNISFHNKDTLEAIAVLGLLANDIEHRVDQLGAFGVVTFGPVVAGAGLAEDEVVGAEDLAEGPRSDGVHGAGLQIHEHRARHVPAAAGLVVVDVDALQLQLRVAAVAAGVVDAVLVADHLPELGADLVAALAALDVEDLSHLPACLGRGKMRGKVKCGKMCGWVWELGNGRFFWRGWGVVIGAERG